MITQIKIIKDFLKVVGFDRLCNYEPLILEIGEVEEILKEMKYLNDVYEKKKLECWK